MRVIAGKARSLPLKAPAGMKTRPTTDRIKETLFNMLQSQIADSVFVDLFSGSGSIGIEALSRGANKAYFIESDRKAVECIRDNLNFTKFSDQAQVLAQDAVSGVYSIKEAADIIFMDPPYDNGLEQRALEALRHNSIADSNTLIIIEASADTDFSYLDEYGYTMIKEKHYGSNRHVFIRKGTADD